MAERQCLDTHSMKRIGLEFSQIRYRLRLTITSLVNAGKIVQMSTYYAKYIIYVRRNLNLTQ